MPIQVSWLECPACTNLTFSMHFHEAKPAWRFLWWHRPLMPATIELWCLNCHFRWDGHQPGTLARGTDVFDTQKVRVVP